MKITSIGRRVDAMPIQINENEREAIETLYSSIKDQLNVKKLILFGSRARGDSDEYSDIDLLVLTESPKTFSDRNKLADYSAGINVDYGVTISCFYYNSNDWDSGEMINPLLKQNVEREGIEFVIQ
jgi:predicted nucleotidyltransferase